MVSLGTMLSSFWILANNSWMQVPVGHAIVDGRIIPADWREIVLGPVMMVRWPHMLLAAFLTTAMCVSATGAWYMLRGVHRPAARVMLHWGLGLAAVLIPVQLFFGHLTGLYVLKHQPAKFAAIEARWQSQQPASEVLIAWPDEASQRNYFAIEIPRLGSFIASGNWTARETGLDAFPVEDRPPVLIPFFGFRIMVGMGLIMLGVSWLGNFLRWRGRLETTRWFLWAHVPVVPDRVHCRAERLVHRRGRPPALGRLRPPANPRRGDAVADHRRRAPLAHRLRAGLCRLRRVRHLLHLQAAPRRAGRRGRGDPECDRQPTAGVRRHGRQRHRQPDRSPEVTSMTDPSTLALFWAAVIAAAILIYVLLDGFDIGVGILFGTTRDEAKRGQMMTSIAPFWDGNETWLVVIGASLFAAFPAAYAVFLGAFYLPVLLMLVGLIFRGIAFEFRYRSAGMRRFWDAGFAYGSMLVAFVQGAAVGAMMRGIPVENMQYAGDAFTWLHPFPVLTGIGLMLGYALLGACWIVFKTEGALRDWAYARIPWLVAAVFAVLGLAFIIVADDRFRRHCTEQSWPAQLGAGLADVQPCRPSGPCSPVCGHDATPFRWRWRWRSFARRF